MRIETAVLIATWLGSILEATGVSREIDPNRVHRQLPNIGYAEQNERRRRKGAVINLLQAGKAKGGKGGKGKKEDIDSADEVPETRAPSTMVKSSQKSTSVDETAVPSGPGFSKSRTETPKRSPDSSGSSKSAKREKKKKSKNSKSKVKTKKSTKKSPKGTLSPEETSPPSLAPVLSPSEDGPSQTRPPIAPIGKYRS
jgi:hypothetical protein